MIPVFTPSDYDAAKTFDKLPLKCVVCDSTFHRTKKLIRDALNPNINKKGDFCSRECQTYYHFTRIGLGVVDVVCKLCDKPFSKKTGEIKNTKNNFCSSSCAATYNNRNKSFGIRRSKLEIYLESELKLLYPNTDIHFNRKDAINSELDIYFPTLKLAFELNGPLHYEPIFGADKLQQIENNDERKFQACLEQSIELCIVNVSKHSYVTKKSCDFFLSAIVDIIQKKAGKDGIEPSTC